MKITPVSSIEKGLGAVQGSAFELEETLELIKHRPVKPLILTALLTGIKQDNFLVTDTYVYDDETVTSALPTGKAYSDFGGRVAADKARQFRFGVPSFGISGNVSPKDYANRRKAGSNELQDEAYVLNKLNDKIGAAWDNFNEQQLLSLIINGTNNVLGGAYESYDFAQIITGTSRGSASNVEFGASGDPIAALRTHKKAIQTEMIKAGEVGAEIVCLCSSGFFEKRLAYERMTGVARELRSTYDFISEEVSGTVMPTDGYRVDNFVGAQDGIRYIEYAGSIGGVGIGTDEAFMFPVQAENFIKRAYAPAQTRSYVNTEAMSVYGWSNVDERKGVSLWEESNVLNALVNPKLIRGVKAIVTP